MSVCSEGMLKAGLHPDMMKNLRHENTEKNAPKKQTNTRHKVLSPHNPDTATDGEKYQPDQPG